MNANLIRTGTMGFFQIKMPWNQTSGKLLHHRSATWGWCLQFRRSWIRKLLAWRQIDHLTLTPAASNEVTQLRFQEQTCVFGIDSVLKLPTLTINEGFFNVHLCRLEIHFLEIESCSCSSTARRLKTSAFWSGFFFCFSACWSWIWSRRYTSSWSVLGIRVTWKVVSEPNHLASRLRPMKCNNFSVVTLYYVLNLTLVRYFWWVSKGELFHVCQRLSSCCLVKGDLLYQTITLKESEGDLLIYFGARNPLARSLGLDAVLFACKKRRVLCAMFFTQNLLECMPGIRSLWISCDTFGVQKKTST